MAAAVPNGAVISYGNLSRDWRDRRREVNRGNDPDARFRFFLDMNREMLRLARATRRAEGRTPAVESTVIRSVVTHTVLGSEEASRFVITPEDLPECPILLDVDEGERQDRLLKRDGDLVFSSHWDVPLHERAGDVRDLYCFVYQALGLEIVDANRDIPEVAADIRRIANLG
jgi:hypothetical protein